MTLFTSPFSKVSVFTCPHWNKKRSVFKSLHLNFETVFVFIGVFFNSGVLVWMAGENVFQTKRISVDGALIYSILSIFIKEEMDLEFSDDFVVK